MSLCYLRQLCTLILFGSRDKENVPVRSASKEITGEDGCLDSCSLDLLLVLYCARNVIYDDMQAYRQSCGRGTFLAKRSHIGRRACSACLYVLSEFCMLAKTAVIVRLRGSTMFTSSGFSYVLHPRRGYTRQSPDILVRKHGLEKNRRRHRDRGTFLVKKLHIGRRAYAACL